MSKVDEAIVEIDAALVDMAPRHEGLRDFNALNIHEDTHAAVAEAIAQYDRRKTLLLATRERLVALVTDGYPVLDIPDVTVSVLADLQENKTTIDAALAQFHSSPATSLGLGAEAPTPK